MERPIQVGSEACRWANPNDQGVWRLFTRLVDQCEPSQCPGVLILTDQGHTQSALFLVKNLRRELPALLEQHPGLRIGYWRVIAKEEEGANYLQQLTFRPTFDDRV
jgi:hypothetical protein